MTEDRIARNDGKIRSKDVAVLNDDKLSKIVSSTTVINYTVHSNTLLEC